MINSERIKQKAREYGADLCGIGDVRLYEGSPPQRDPRFILPKATAVIGVALRVPRGIYRGILAGTQHYTYTSLGVKALSEEIAGALLLKMARVIENEGYEACIQRSTPGLRIKDDLETNPEVTATRRLIHTEPVGPGKPAPEVILDETQSAVICGLGTPGYRGNVLTPEFGPFQRFAFIITNAPLAPDPVLAESLCDQCGACADACPGKAICGSERTLVVGDRAFPYGGWDTWQCSVYYRGAHRSNPFMPADFLRDHPEREAILNGEKRFSREEALAIYDRLKFLPNTHYGYVPCLCGKACDTACYAHLERKGLIRKKFAMDFIPEPATGGRP